MNKHEQSAFENLFREVHLRCFGHPLKAPLSEPESKLLSNAILEKTGLVVGWKSLKNYSAYVLDKDSAREENPTVATLDTLARYLLNARRTDEVQRQKNEGHHPYWFEYRAKFESIGKRRWRTPRYTPLAVVGAVVLLLLIFLMLSRGRLTQPQSFTENFASLGDSLLISRGWMVIERNPSYWARRGEAPGSLSLFTLFGDSWPDSARGASVQNLLVRSVPAKCFTIEVHMRDFVPEQNWQQAGILLLEDTLFAGKSVRFSLAYNDFAGGFAKSRQVLLQVISSPGGGSSRPEEVAHQNLFQLGENQDTIVKQNLHNSALRIEKRGTLLRFLYSGGPMDNAAFKEVTSREFEIEPRYVALFAVKGFVDSTAVVPVRFTFFSAIGEPCEDGN
ncbi:MAG TPA: hypothetical protein VMG34_15320 [Bacteroidota bacterium]|nr:hypothetical protein [Bacteroidota bacterium]